MEFITEGLVGFELVFSSILRNIKNYPVLGILLVVSLSIVGFKVFKRAKRTARS